MPPVCLSINETKFPKLINTADNGSFSKLTNMIEEFTSINKESDKFLYNYFNDLERMVDLKRNVLISEINNISSELKLEIIDKKKEIKLKIENNALRYVNGDNGLLNGYKTQHDNYNQKLEDYLRELREWENGTTGDINKMDISGMKCYGEKFNSTNMNDSTQLFNKIQKDQILNKVFF